MATTGTTGAAPSSSKPQWWSRSSSNKAQPSTLLRTDSDTLYGTQHSPRGSLMTPVTSPKSMSSNAFSTSSAKSPSSRFNFSAVLPSFTSKSKKQQPLDIQDPPSQVRSLPTPKSSVYRHFALPSPPSSSIPNPRLSRGVASTTSGASRASTSTDGPLTPDDPFPATRVSYQHSLMTLTDSDPFASESPLGDRRGSTHSDKSIGKRLMSRVEGKSKATSRLPVGDGPKRKDSRDRSATLPSRGRSATDASEAYLPLRAVEPPWQPSSPPASPDSPTMSPLRLAVADNSARAGPSNPGVLRRPKSAKPSLPWPEVRPSLQSHQRTHSSSSLAKEFPEAGRPSMASSPARTSASAIPLPLSPTSPVQTSPPASAGIRPPRPPPTQELPPTPGSPKHLRVHPDTVASASASSASFSSSLSSLSFTSRPSPQDAVPAQAYPSLLAETLPPDALRRGSDSGSSTGGSAGGSHAHTPRSDPGHKLSRPSTSRPLPSPPVQHERERALSTTSTIGDGTSSIRTLRKQRSFHNTSLHAPSPRTPTLRHYNSFEPVRSPPPPPPNDLPPLPPPSSPPAGKRTTSAGKDATTSPRRKLFSSHKHDRERERKQEQEAPVTSTPASPSPLRTSSSWHDDTKSHAVAETTMLALPDVAQHIVPPAELLRLGAAWERESESLHKAGGRPVSRLPPPPRSAGNLGVAAPAWGSRLPRSASLLSKASSAPESPIPPDSYTSLSPPPRRARPPAAATTRRTLSNATPPSTGTGGARVERKPSFLDMTPRRSVSIELPDQRDSFLELSRGMDSIDTIRESEASFQ